MHLAAVGGTGDGDRASENDLYQSQYSARQLQCFHGRFNLYLLDITRSYGVRLTMDLCQPFPKVMYFWLIIGGARQVDFESAATDPILLQTFCKFQTQVYGTASKL